MKQLPTTKENTSYARFWEMLHAGNKARLMVEAIKLQIFDHLQTPVTAEELAEKYCYHPGNTALFLDSLVTANLLSKKGGRYSNLPDTADFLVSGKPEYQGYMLQFMQGSHIDPLQQHLPDLLRQGPQPAPEGEGAADETFWHNLTKESASWVIGETGEAIARIVASLDGFNDFGSMLDLGGGHGMFALYLAQAHPSMRAVIFDRPMVTGVAQEFIHHYDMADRVSVLSGDYSVDDIGSGYDLIWASSTLNFIKSNLDEMLGKIHNALNPGGYFIAFQDGLTDEHTQPDIMLGSLLSAMQAGMDFAFDQGKIAAAMIQTGFQSVRSRTFYGPMGTMDMDIARKALEK